MAIKNKKEASRQRRKRSIRQRIRGTEQRPRLSVFRSNKHIYAQVIDDVSGKTIASASSQSATIREQLDGKKKTEVAELVGQTIATMCKDKEIGAVVFDRNGFIYHGRVKAVAEGARSGGLTF
ncbi:MAG: 50S ribosomal protein L18 [Myxococcales bacterium]|nr:50S ribosomal protein L18 [Myxococcales bacterium]